MVKINLNYLPSLTGGQSVKIVLQDAGMATRNFYLTPHVFDRGIHHNCQGVFHELLFQQIQYFEFI